MNNEKLKLTLKVEIKKNKLSAEILCSLSEEGL